jgi:hypothetical protein
VDQTALILVVFAAVVTENSLKIPLVVEVMRNTMLVRVVVVVRTHLLVVLTWMLPKIQ